MFLHPGGAGPLTKVLPKDVSITLGCQSEALGRQARGWRSADHPGTLGKRDEVVSIFLYLNDWTGLGRWSESPHWCFPGSSGGRNPPSPGVLLALLLPQLGSLVPSRWAPQSRWHCPFNRSSLGRSRALPGTVRARPPACARPPVPRPSLPPQLALPGRAPAAGAAAAAAPGARVRRPPPGDPARGGGSPDPAPDLSRSRLTLPGKFVPLRSAERLGEPLRDEGFPHSPSCRGQAPSVGWGSSYEGRWQPELIQPPWSGARTPAEEGGSIWSHGWCLGESGGEGSALQRS